MDELLDSIPTGRLLPGAAALLAIPGVRKSLRPVAKVAIKAGVTFVVELENLMVEAREQASDLYAEAKAESEAATDIARTPKAG
jgi:hypothetical protein